MAQKIGHLSTKREALSSNSSTTKKKDKKKRERLTSDLISLPVMYCMCDNYFILHIGLWTGCSDIVVLICIQLSIFLWPQAFFKKIVFLLFSIWNRHNESAFGSRKCFKLCCFFFLGKESKTFIQFSKGSVVLRCYSHCWASATFQM
jgi:hypothetical protein